MARDIHAQPIPLPKFPMSAFDLGYSLKTCSSAGRMNCHYVEECIPSDIAHIRTDLFIRLDPLTFPIMHRVKVRQNFFFVPSRLVLGDEMQEEFFSCKDLGAKLPSVKFPEAAMYSQNENPLGKNTLFDQMCCQPVSVVSPYTRVFEIRNLVPFLSYQLIYKDWYADELLDATEIADIDTQIDAWRALGLNGSGSWLGGAIGHMLNTRFVSYSKDRFTSAQPDAQRVGEVYLMNPLTLSKTDGTFNSSNVGLYLAGTTSPPAGIEPGQVYAGSSPFSVRPTLTIDELWDEMAVQRFLNSLNEFGNERYTEILAGQYGVLSADSRLQRAQWIGGNEMVVNVSEVLQTSETTSNSPLGSLGGRGLVSGRGRDIVFRVPEHGYILGILTIVPENGYASGSPRWLYKSTPLDFAMPRFNNLGEQAVYNGELFSDQQQDADTGDFGEFGYQPQYDEYRSHPSYATGDFRETQFLAWHLDRKFTSVPPLNDSFIHISASETNRIFNDTDPTAQHYRIHAFHKSMYVRPISRHPIPGKL